MGAIWIDTGAGADEAIGAIRQHPVAGYDSEFYGVDVGKESCVGRSILDVFSIAVATETLHPIGFKVPQAYVFTPELITHDSVRAYLEDARFRKVIHNRTVDEHTARNAGIRIRGGLDTLNMARWVYPERAALVRGNYDLDSLCRWRVGVGKTEDFNEFLGYDADEPYEAEITQNRCLGCLELGCRKKKPPHDIGRVPERVTVTRTKRVRRFEDLRGIRPGHPKFDRYLAYAAVDAELAFILYQCMLLDGRKERAYPWGYL